MATPRALSWTTSVALGLLLVGCVVPTNGNASPTASPAGPASSSPGVGVVASQPISPLPLLDPPSLTFLLPAEFAPNGSSVSPDGRFVAARARDWGRVVLYRITRPSPRASLAQIAPVAEVRGFAQEMSWLEDSSAVLVGTDLDPTKTIQNHDPSMQGQRIAILNIDGRVVIAPENARQVLNHRAHASPDGGWIWVDDRCCAQQALLLSRDGSEVRQVIPPAPTGVALGFAGWDREGNLLYWEVGGGRSTLVAVEPGGLERYRIAAPRDFGAVDWGVVAFAPDRSWQLVQLSGGMGSSFRALRLLVGHDLRSVPDQLEASRYGPFPFGDEIAYADETGKLRAYNPATGRVRDLPLRLDVSLGPASIGISDGFFAWMELTRGYVADLATGRRVPLPLQKTGLSVSIVEGARLAEYHFDDNAIVIFDLATIAKE